MMRMSTTTILQTATVKTRDLQIGSISKATTINLKRRLRSSLKSTKYQKSLHQIASQKGSAIELPRIAEIQEQGNSHERVTAILDREILIIIKARVSSPTSLLVRGRWC